MDTFSLTVLIGTAAIAVANGIGKTMTAINTLFRVIELYLQRKAKRETQPATKASQQKDSSRQAKRRRQRRE